jgi:hypothetical protein
MLDLTFPKMVIVNNVKFSFFTMKDGREFATGTSFPQQIGPVEDNPTIARTLCVHVKLLVTYGHCVCLHNFL